MWWGLQEELRKEEKSRRKVENNGHRVRLRGLLSREGRRVPRWLDRSAASVLEGSATMLEDSALAASTPRPARRAAGARVVASAQGVAPPPEDAPPPPPLP